MARAVVNVGNPSFFMAMFCKIPAKSMAMETQWGIFSWPCLMTKIIMRMYLGHPTWRTENIRTHLTNTQGLRILLEGLELQDSHIYPNFSAFLISEIIWWFPQIGVAPVIIHLLKFSIINQAFFGSLDSPMTMETPLFASCDSSVQRDENLFAETLGVAGSIQPNHSSFFFFWIS